MSTRRPSKRLLVFASLTAFALALFATRASTRATGPQTVVVTITPGNAPTVSPDPVQISKSAGDQVEWECPDCTNGFAVHFPQGTPFDSSSFNKANPNSGAVRGNAATHLYHYTVTVNGHTADPGVQVNP